MRADLTHGNLFIRSFISVMFIARMLSPSDTCNACSRALFLVFDRPSTITSLTVSPTVFEISPEASISLLLS